MAEPPTIAELAEAVADGRTVDWPSVQAAASDDAERAAIDRLKRIHQLAGQLRSPGSTGASEFGAATAAGGVNAGDAHAHWGHLTILEKVGEGAFGEVYRAHDPKLARDVALKLLRVRASSAPDATSAIEEGRLLARIRHPNVVTVYGADRIDGRVGLWMEFVRGRTLEQELQERGPFNVHEAAQIGVELTRALAAVHAAGLVHRDVKAQNVMREEDGRLVLMDFGTGREQTPSASTDAGDLAGTPLYVAPEVLEGGAATARSDIYSLGVLLYHLVTGGYPTTADTLGSLVEAHRTRTRTSLATSRPDLPAAFVEIVERAVMADPDARYGTVREMEAALTRVPQAPVSLRARHPWLVGSGVLAAVAAAVVVLMFWRPWSRPAPQPPSLDGLPGSRLSLPAPQPTTAPISAESNVQIPRSPAPTSGPMSWVLIAAFDNRTKAAELERLFVEDLQQELKDVPFIQLASHDRVEEALQLMRRPVNALLDAETARQVCERDGHINALITARAEASVHGISLNAQVVNPTNGTVIANIPGMAAGESDLPAAIRQEAHSILLRLYRLPRGQPQFAHVTTPSMDALKLYSLAITPSDATGSAPDLVVQEKYLHDAIAADSRFASAYLRLAVVIDAQRRPRSESEPYMERARQLAETASIAERSVIAGITHYWRARELADDARRTEAAIAATALKAALLIEPSDSLALDSLHSTYSMLGLPFEVATIVAPSADARPLNFSANAGAAVLRARQGDLDGANHYWERAANVEDPKDRGIVWFRLFPAERDWAQGLAKQASRQVEVALAGADRMSPNVRANLMRDAVERLTTLGRMSRAVVVANSIADDQTNPRAGAIAMVLERREARSELSDFLAPHTADRLGYLLRHLWIPAGRLDELKAVMKMRGSAPDPAIDIEIAFAENRFDDAVASGSAYLLQKRESGGHPALRVPTTLARAMVALGKQDDALRLLAEYGRRSPLMAAEDDQGYDWMRLRADLAARYRATGQFPEARAIEQDLLKRLAVADPDFPLLREIQRSVR